MTRRRVTDRLQIRPPDGTIPISDAAELLGISRQALLEWFNLKKVRGWRHDVNRRVWIYESEVERIARQAIEERSPDSGENGR